MIERSGKRNYFYVQVKGEDGLPEIIHHSVDEETGEHYYKFLLRAQANKLLLAQKKINPQNQYRVVRQVEQFFATSWE